MDLIIFSHEVALVRLGSVHTSSLVIGFEYSIAEDTVLS